MPKGCAGVFFIFLKKFSFFCLIFLVWAYILSPLLYVQDAKSLYARRPSRDSAAEGIGQLAAVVRVGGFCNIIIFRMLLL